MWWGESSNQILLEYGLDKTAIPSAREIGTTFITPGTIEYSLISPLVQAHPPSIPQRDRPLLFGGTKTAEVTKALRKHDPDAGAHSLRKSYAHRALARGAPSAAVSTVLRHRRPQTLDSYRQMDVTKEIKEAVLSCLR